MKVTVLTTGTNNTAVLYSPLKTLGHDLSVIGYDDMTYEEHKRLPGLVDATSPDFVLLIGALEEHHGKPVPNVDIFARIGAKHPLVNFCCDGAEPLWWAQLERYYERGNFALQINIDGVRTGPIGERGMTALCPVDPAEFKGPAWNKERSILLGFGGNTHRGVREAMLNDLVRDRIVTWRPRDEEAPDGYRKFLRSCKCQWNHPMTGGTTRQHVKARILEAALSGCLVFEAKGSPAGEWFEPGIDYIEYETPADIEAMLAWVRSAPKAAEAIAMKLKKKVTERHRPAVFWAQVFERLGFGTTEHQLHEPSFRPWNLEAAQREVVEDRLPRLLLSRDKHNFVSFENWVFIIPQSLGPLDLANESNRRLQGVRRFGTLDEAERML